MIMLLTTSVRALFVPKGHAGLEVVVGKKNIYVMTHNVGYDLSAPHSPDIKKTSDHLLNKNVTELDLSYLTKPFLFKEFS